MKLYIQRNGVSDIGTEVDWETDPVPQIQEVFKKNLGVDEVHLKCENGTTLIFIREN
jgi:hypothetical protein